MTLAQFMDASYALLVEEHQRIDPFKDFMTVAEKVLPTETKTEKAPSPDEVERQNAASLAQLEGMLKGVSRRGS